MYLESIRAITGLVKSIESQTFERKKALYIDRGIGTFRDGYITVEELKKIANYYMQQTKLNDMRDRMSFLLSHYNLLRSESLRILEYPDLFHIKFENEGVTDCNALVLVLNQGKTNQLGKMEISGCIRNKHVDLCPIGSVGLYFFYCFHVTKKPFPKFEKSEDWYDLKLCPAKNDPKGSISYDTQLSSIKKCFKAVGIQSSRKTHIGRGNGAIMAELAGASDNSTRRLGRWNRQAMENCYMSSLPREAIRALAGFDPQNPQYYLKRAAVTPSETLQRQIFPEIEVWLEKLYKGEIESNIAAGGFLDFLKYLRVVILQDSAILKQQYHDHPIFQHKIFQSSEFSHFQQELLHIQENESDPIEVQIQNVLPSVATRLDTMSQVVRDGVLQLETVIKQGFYEQDRKLSDVFQGRASIRLNVEYPERSNTNQNENVVSTTEQRPEANNHVISVPTTGLLRHIRTIPELWKEWFEGIESRESVEEMNRKWGRQWRARNKDEQFYSRRKKIIDILSKKMTEEHMSAIEICNTYERKRAAMGKTIDWISKHLDDFFST
jgi:hypothetical protein